MAELTIAFSFATAVFSSQAGSQEIFKSVVQAITGEAPEAVGGGKPNVKRVASKAFQAEQAVENNKEDPSEVDSRPKEAAKHISIPDEDEELVKSFTNLHG